MNKMNQSTVFVVDDDPLLRQSLCFLFESEGFPVVSYESGEDFLAAFDDRHRGCLVLDLIMTGMGGLEVQAELTKRGSRMPIVFLSGCGDIPTTVNAIKAGAEDFFTKPPDFRMLVEKVQALLEKSYWLENQTRESDELNARLGNLTNREREIFGLAISGLSSKEIAKKLSLSQRTVENHRLRVNKKLHSGSLLEFCHRAAKCGIELGLPSPSA
jgi:two-component system, LuxR family, response regulator FixJ